MNAPSRTNQAPSRIRLDRELFEELCRAKGAELESERAALLGVARSTVRKWLKGDIGPRLTQARRVAQTLGSTPDELWPQDKRAA